MPTKSNSLDLLAVEDRIAEVRQRVATAWLAVQGMASGAVSKDGHSGLQFLLADIQDDLQSLGGEIAKARGVTHSAADLRVSLRRNASRRKVAA